MSCVHRMLISSKLFAYSVPNVEKLNCFVMLECIIRLMWVNPEDSCWSCGFHEGFLWGMTECRDRSLNTFLTTSLTTYWVQLAFAFTINMLESCNSSFRNITIQYSLKPTRALFHQDTCCSYTAHYRISIQIKGMLGYSRSTQPHQRAPLTRCLVLANQFFIAPNGSEHRNTYLRILYYICH